MSQHNALCGCGGCIAPPGMGAVWAVPTNYDWTSHRRYVPGMGEVVLGDSGWTLGDVASLSLIILAGVSLYRVMNGHKP